MNIGNYFIILCIFYTIWSDPDEKMTKVYTILSRMTPLNEYQRQRDENSLNEKYSSVDSIILDWPIGTYGLLATQKGCPDSKNTNWKIGWLFQHTEDRENENNSSILHANVIISNYGIRQSFCIKDNSDGVGVWEKGSYCIYQYGNTCPHDFHSGYVYWDDENNNNKNAHFGYLPRGNYGQDTEIRFCCRNDGDILKEISLPTHVPFCLFPQASPSCQKVRNMEHILEYIKFNDEDKDNKNTQGGYYPYGIQPLKRDHYLYYCYYFSTNKTITTPEIENPVAFTNLSNSTYENLNLLAKVGTKASHEKINKWLMISSAVALVTLILGLTTFLGLKQIFTSSYTKLKEIKKYKNPQTLNNFKVQVSKKYITSKIEETKKIGMVRMFEGDEHQELEEDNLVPNNSELQHSLALLFMKSKK